MLTAHPCVYTPFLAACGHLGRYSETERSLASSPLCSLRKLARNLYSCDCVHERVHVRPAMEGHAGAERAMGRLPTWSTPVLFGINSLSALLVHGGQAWASFRGRKQVAELAKKHNCMWRLPTTTHYRPVIYLSPLWWVGVRASLCDPFCVLLYSCHDDAYPTFERYLLSPIVIRSYAPPPRPAAAWRDHDSRFS
jgi:hypothetical protein